MGTLLKVLGTTYDESTHAFTEYFLGFRSQDGLDIQDVIQDFGQLQHAEYQLNEVERERILEVRIVEALAHWIHYEAGILDEQVVRTSGDTDGNLAMFLKKCGEDRFHTSNSERWFAPIFDMTVHILGQEAACLGHMLCGLIEHYEFVSVAESPSTTIALMVQKLEELRAKVSTHLIQMNPYRSYDDSKTALWKFFQYYTVETDGSINMHDSVTHPQFVGSSFRVNLVNSSGCLLALLRKLEVLIDAPVGGTEITLAVDFEGVKLCRSGALCLLQMTCSDDPTLVYVLDICVLGALAFNLATPSGLSMKRLLERADVRKAWFDPRNDVDALYHQFCVKPDGIFDIQLAEVADRRRRGLQVQYVQGLTQCLTNCPTLLSDQKAFAERINALGKNIFEPSQGGDHQSFLQRPLNPILLVYAAQGSRYMLDLHHQFVGAIGSAWAQRVLDASKVRSEWYLSPLYVEPNAKAPDF